MKVNELIETEKQGREKECLISVGNDKLQLIDGVG
jgi:hypothetical protein